jgi:hypothetical protein
MSTIAQRCGPDLHVAFTDGTQVTINQDQIRAQIAANSGDLLGAAWDLRDQIVAGSNGHLAAGQINLAVGADGEPLVLEITGG